MGIKLNKKEVRYLWESQRVLRVLRNEAKMTDGLHKEEKINSLLEKLNKTWFSNDTGSIIANKVDHFPEKLKSHNLEKEELIFEDETTKNVWEQYKDGYWEV